MSTNTTCHDGRETLRRRAVELHQRCWSQVAIADALGVSQSAVSKWLHIAQTQGLEALGRITGTN